MIDKAKKLITATITRVKTRIPMMRQPIKWVVFLYFGIVALLVLTYYGAWLWQWHEGKVVMNDLLSLIREMVGTSMVAFVTFIAGCMVDTNKNNIPDQFEDREEGRK